MAMLAEPRRRQRIGPNPRGKFFSEDEDNRGRNLLQKLGWKDGDGLGVQKQGIVEPVKPKIQMNSNGLGFDIKRDPWMEHSKDFAAVLENLQTVHVVSVEDNKEDVRAELETKSKHSRSRIHYHKFTRGKDLSSISSKDWTCIFGNNLQSPSGNSVSKEATLSFGQDDSVASLDSTLNEDVKPVVEDLNTVNMGSMHDYFKSKMAEKLAGQKIVETVNSKKKSKRKTHGTAEIVEPSSDKEVEDKERPVVEDLNTVNMGSMHDYFKSKMAKKLAGQKIVEAVNSKKKSKRKIHGTAEIVEPSSDKEVEDKEGESGPMNEVWEKKKSRFLAPEEIRELEYEFKGSNLSKIRGYGLS